MKDVKHQQDLWLLHRYLCGDSEAGKELFAAAYPSLIKFVYSKTKDDTLFSAKDKEDIVSESMTRVIDKLHLYNGTSQFKSFIIGYAKNIIMEQRRKKIKDTSKTVTLDEIINVDNINFFDEPLKVLIDREQITAVNQALSALEKDYKDILTLRIFNEMPFKQVAQLTGKSDAAVDSLFRRALKAFKKNFENIYNNSTDF